MYGAIRNFEMEAGTHRFSLCYIKEFQGLLDYVLAWL